MTLVSELERQRQFIQERVPVYGRLLESLAALQGTEAWARIEAAWADRSFYAAYDRPLLLLASLRFDALSEGEGHPLWPAISDSSPAPDQVGRDALLAALEPSRRRFWEAMRSRHLQTNETSRSIAWLWPASYSEAPIALVDLGASAGLNLCSDSLPMIWTDQNGNPLPEAGKRPVIVKRLGLDKRPIDALDEEQVRWLRACVWPGEMVRLQRLDAAVEAFRACAGRQDGPVIEEMPASRMAGRLASLGAEVGEEPLILAYQTIVRDYLEPGERKSHEAGMKEWLEARPRGKALWMELESEPGGAPDLPATLVAHAKGEDGRLHSIFLARCGYHPRILYVDPAGPKALERLLAK